MATLGEGNITIGSGEEIGNINREVNNTTKGIFTSNTGTKVDMSVDHRIYTEDGQKDIAEDFTRNTLTVQALSDVISKESVEMKDIIEHIDVVQKNLDVQKKMANEDGGENFKILNDPNATPEQKQKAIQAYAKAYADVYGVSVEEATVVAVDSFIKGATHNQEGNNNIYINDNAQENLLDYAETMGHEATHALINQDKVRDRSEDDKINGEKLNEEYADIIGDYSAQNAEFAFANSEYDLGNLNTGNSNNHVGNAVSEVMRNNTDNFISTVNAHSDEMDYSHLTIEDYRMFKEKNEYNKQKLQELVDKGLGDSDEAKELKEQIKQDTEEIASYGETEEEVMQKLHDLSLKLDEDGVKVLATLAVSKGITPVIRSKVRDVLNVINPKQIKYNIIRAIERRIKDPEYRAKFNSLLLGFGINSSANTVVQYLTSDEINWLEVVINGTTGAYAATAKSLGEAFVKNAVAGVLNTASNEFITQGNSLFNDESYGNIAKGMLWSSIFGSVGYKGTEYFSKVVPEDFYVWPVPLKPDKYVSVPVTEGGKQIMTPYNAEAINGVFATTLINTLSYFGANEFLSEILKPNTTLLTIEEREKFYKDYIGE